MKLHEFLSKEIMRSYGIPVPKSFLVRKGESPKNFFLPCVLKSQVLVGSRMKNGGVLFVNTPQEFEHGLKILLGKKIKDEIPFGVLVEEKIPTKHEHYLSLILDRDEKDISLIYSNDGGIDVETSQNFVKGQFDRMVKNIDPRIAKIALILRRIALEKDITLLEINPLGEMENGEFIALDAVFYLDDSAIYRQSWVKKFAEENPYPFNYVKLEGNIGIIGCGAGIVMATIDMVKLFGGEPADFLDLGGGANKDVTVFALETLKGYGIRKTIMNIFGGITKCDEIARAIVDFKKRNPDYMLYVRLTGTNEEKAKEVLEKNHINYYKDMYSMVESAVAGDEM